MFSGFSKNLLNGLRVCVDWIAFTLVDADSVDDALDFLGIPISEFALMPRGMHGYAAQLRHPAFPLQVLYNGNAGMGVHVIIPGSAVHDVLVRYQHFHESATPFGLDAMDVREFDTTVLREFLGDVLKNGQVTRLDLAIDDVGAKYFDMPDISERLCDGRYVSKFRNWRELVQRGASSGRTIYLGSAKSAIMLRIYDKQAEQNAKLERVGEPLIECPWVRWEMEIKQSRANKAARALASGMSVSDVTIGVLSNYIRFVKLDNERIDRCTIDSAWDDFCAGVRKFSIYESTPPKTIDDTKRWLMHQVSASLASVVISDGGDSAFIHDLLHVGALRLASHDESVLDLLEVIQ